MPKTPKANAPLDPDDAEWTREHAAKAMRLHELPPHMQAAFLQMQKEGLKPMEEREDVTISLPSEVARAVRATGPDWESRIEETLREKFAPKAA